MFFMKNFVVSEPAISSSQTLCLLESSSPSSTSHPSSSTIGYLAGLGVISVILVTSLLGNVTLVFVVLNMRRGRYSNK